MRKKVLLWLHLEKKGVKNPGCWGGGVLRGRGRSEVDFHFFIVSNRGEC